MQLTIEENKIKVTANTPSKEALKNFSQKLNYLHIKKGKTASCSKA